MNKQITRCIQKLIYNHYPRREEVDQLIADSLGQQGPNGAWSLVYFQLNHNFNTTLVGAYEPNTIWQDYGSTIAIDFPFSGPILMFCDMASQFTGDAEFKIRLAVDGSADFSLTHFHPILGTDNQPIREHLILGSGPGSEVVDSGLHDLKLQVYLPSPVTMQTFGIYYFEGYNNISVFQASQ